MSQRLYAFIFLSIIIDQLIKDAQAFYRDVGKIFPPDFDPSESGNVCLNCFHLPAFSVESSGKLKALREVGIIGIQVNHTTS